MVERTVGIENYILTWQLLGRYPRLAGIAISTTASIAQMRRTNIKHGCSKRAIGPFSGMTGREQREGGCQRWCQHTYLVTYIGIGKVR